MIRCVVFDVGGVVFLPGTFRPIYQTIADRCRCRVEDIMLPIRLTWREWETGHISEREYFYQLSQLTEGEFSVHELKEMIYKKDHLNEELVGVISKLKEKVHVVALSNLAREFYQHLWKEFDLHGLFHQEFTSFEIGVSKPYPEIYEHIMAELGLDGKELLFFDDKEKGVNGAKAVGWNAFVYTDVKELKKVLLK